MTTIFLLAMGLGVVLLGVIAVRSAHQSDAVLSRGETHSYTTETRHCRVCDNWGPHLVFHRLYVRSDGIHHVYSRDWQKIANCLVCGDHGGEVEAIYPPEPSKNAVVAILVGSLFLGGGLALLLLWSPAAWWWMLLRWGGGGLLLLAYLVTLVIASMALDSDASKAVQMAGEARKAWDRENGR
jgi:hypothetical protein